MTDTLPLPNQVIAQRYRVVRELGRGGMGVVYVVEHVRTGDRLALKLLHGRAAKDPMAVERFKREAQAAARIRSDHVVKVVDADVAPELDQAPFLVMELLDGLDLEKLLAQRRRFSPEEVVSYLGQAARALDRSHGMGIVHRDLKPENLFLHHREDGSTILKIVDFGISKLVGGDGGDLEGAGMTSTGAVMGTPLYMAPEQARGLASHISAATDVWALGLIAVRLLTGEIYWRANTVSVLLLQIVSEPLYAPTQRWPYLPAAVDGWFARSCARDPTQRFHSVGEQVEALAAALGLSVSLSTTGPPVSAPQVGGAGPPVPGAATTNHPLSKSEASTPVRPRSWTPLLLAALVALGLAWSGWAVHAKLALTERPSTSTTAASGPLASASPRPSALPAMIASTIPPDGAADGGARAAADEPTPSGSTSATSPSAQRHTGDGVAPVRTPHNRTPFAPTSP